jgi:Fe-Mn family superoxide dismutase
MSMKPGGGGRPYGEMRQALDAAFGSYDHFRRMFTQSAVNEFGSGWAWLVCDADGKLLIRSTTDADNPLRHDQVPLLTLDVWEHAYYLDYQHERENFVHAFVDHLIDWDFVAENHPQWCS